MVHSDGGGGGGGGRWGLKLLCSFFCENLCFSSQVRVLLIWVLRPFLIDCLWVWSS